MSRGRAFVGTSGWSYTSWRPVFYPADLRPRDFLRHYATRLATLEINYTFNHLPTEKNIATWRAATQPEFLFALKASRHITHVRKLGDPADTLPIFYERARPLGDRLGPVLFQTPPWLKRDDDLLAGFLGSLPRDLRAALEVRHPSWYVDEVYELLHTAGVALVHAEGEKAPSPVETIGVTARFAYTRLRKRDGYTGEEVAAWADRFGPMLEAGTDVYAYFRHDATGANALSAERLRDLLAPRIAR